MRKLPTRGSIRLTADSRDAGVRRPRVPRPAVDNGSRSDARVLDGSPRSLLPSPRPRERASALETRESPARRPADERSAMTALIGVPAGRTSAMHEKAGVRKLIADRNNFEVAADGDLSSGRVSVGNDQRTWGQARWITRDGRPRSVEPGVQYLDHIGRAGSAIRSGRQRLPAVSLLAGACELSLQRPSACGKH